MGKAFAKLFGKKDMRILMLGLDAAGKTSILFRFIFRFPGCKVERRVALLPLEILLESVLKIVLESVSKRMPSRCFCAPLPRCKYPHLACTCASPVPPLPSPIVWCSGL